MKKYVLCLLIFIMILSACASQDTGLIGNWKLTAYGPPDSVTPAVSDAEATLTFGDGTVTGNSGCNSLGGEYEVDDDQITFGAITSTLMACDDARMAQESAVTQVMSGTADFEIEGQTLTITNNELVLVFSALPGE
jgi:heat shock protein HslJ